MSRCVRFPVRPFAFRITFGGHRNQHLRRCCVPFRPLVASSCIPPTPRTSAFFWTRLFFAVHRCFFSCFFWFSGTVEGDRFLPHRPPGSARSLLPSQLFSFSFLFFGARARRPRHPPQGVPETRVPPIVCNGDELELSSSLSLSLSLFIESQALRFLLERSTRSSRANAQSFEVAIFFFGSVAEATASVALK